MTRSSMTLIYVEFKVPCGGELTYTICMPGWTNLDEETKDTMLSWAKETAVLLWEGVKEEDVFAKFVTKEELRACLKS